MRIIWKMDESVNGRYLPVHPLPDEIQNLPRNETVCKFCGVSYLIHNEIKLLEDKLRNVEKELQHYKGAAERELKAQRIADALRGENVLLKESVDEVQRALETVRRKLLAAEAAQELECKQHDDAVAKLKAAEAAGERLRAQGDRVRMQLRTVVQQVGELQNAKKHLLHEWGMMVKAQPAMIMHAVETVSACVSREMTEKEASRVKSEQLVQELSLRAASEKAAVANIRSLEAELLAKSEELRQLHGRTRLYDELHESHRGTAEELAAFKLKNDVLRAELQQCQEQTRLKVSEFEAALGQARKKELTSEQQLSLNESQRQQLTSEIKVLREENASLHAIVSDRQKKESEFLNRVSATESQSSVLQEQLERAQSDCEALKLEREQMITAHQRRIEQLRDSFKTKMLQAESWHSKLDGALKEQRDKHQEELTAVKDELKKNFAAEMQIEKQKCHELYEQMVIELRSDNAKLKHQSASAQATANAEVNGIKQQLSLTRAAAEKNEASLRREIVSLKNIVKDLEERLAHLDDGNREQIMELTAQLKAAQRSLSDSKEKETALDRLACDRADEIVLLQETVRRECEERLELTEALNSANEQIAQLSKYGGSNVVLSKPVTLAASQNVAAASSSAKAALSNRRASAEELLLFKHSIQRRPSAKDGMTKKDNAASANNVNISYDATASSSDDSIAAAAIRLKDVSATDEQRRRIAAALGKR